jgi:Fe-S cluster assembly ATP-binding protein
MLSIQDLQVSVAGKAILQKLELQLHAGEVHAIMGPNGSGKSTLAHVLAGRDGYDVVGGSVEYEGEDLLALMPEERAHRGIFLALQYPVELPGVSTMVFLREAVNAQRRARGEADLDTVQFLKQVRALANDMHIDEAMLKRSVNSGFSGGEKKRNEILQMRLLEPKLAILDETDSGLDIDALRIVATGVNASRDPARAILIITHYPRLLEYIQPDVVHVLSKGRIVLSGDMGLARQLERNGYGWIEDEVAA